MGNNQSSIFGLGAAGTPNPLPDDTPLNFGTDSDWSWNFNSATGRFELQKNGVVFMEFDEMSGDPRIAGDGFLRLTNAIGVATRLFLRNNGQLSVLGGVVTDKTNGTAIGVGGSSRVITRTKPMQVTKIFNASLFNVAATTNSEIVFTQPAGTVLRAVISQLGLQFAGTGITALTFSIGDDASFINLLDPAGENLITDANTTIYADRGVLSGWNDGPGQLYTDVDRDWTMKVDSVGGNLDALTAGQFDTWFVIEEVAVPSFFA